MGLFSTTRKVSDLSERLEKLERAFKALQFEWDDTYDKLRRAMGRIVKTHAKIVESENGEEAAHAEVPARDIVGATPGGFLTQRQRQVQQMILKRRAGGS